MLVSSVPLSRRRFGAVLSAPCWLDRLRRPQALRSTLTMIQKIATAGAWSRGSSVRGQLGGEGRPMSCNVREFATPAPSPGPGPAPGLRHGNHIRGIIVILLMFCSGDYGGPWAWQLQICSAGKAKRV